MSGSKLIGAEEFVALPVPSHGRPWNLIEGEIVVNSPSRRHEQAADNILFALKAWTREASGRGSAASPIDIRADDRNVYAPDVHWYGDGRVPPAEARAPYPMPDLAVEVRSRATWRFDVGAKRRGYERHGLPELWLVDTEAKSVLIFRRSRPSTPVFDVAIEAGAGDGLESPLLPGFGLAVQDVFAAD